MKLPLKEGNFTLHLRIMSWIEHGTPIPSPSLTVICEMCHKTIFQGSGATLLVVDFDKIYLMAVEEHAHNI